MAAFNYKTELERYRKYYQSVQPSFQKPVNRAYTAIIFSFLAISLFGWYAIRPTIQTIFTLQRQIKDKTTIDRQMEDKISALIEAQAVYQDISPAIPVLAQALPADTDAVQSVRQLQNLANDTNVTFSNIQVPSVPIVGKSQPDTKKPAATKLENFTLTLTASGTYTDVKAFLEGIGTLRRMIQIESMIFSAQHETQQTASQSASPSPEAAPAGTKVEVVLKLKIFYLGT